MFLKKQNKKRSLYKKRNKSNQIKNKNRNKNRNRNRNRNYSYSSNLHNFSQLLKFL